MTGISKQDADLLFNEAHTHNGWLDKPVDDALLQKAYDLAKMGPTSTNCQPMRIVFVKSKEAKERLRLHMAKGNLDKTMAAPVTAIIAFDNEFFKELEWLSPANNAKTWFKAGEENTLVTARRNGTLQGGYFILACRSVGLDCGPMSGFDNAGVDKEFFAGTEIKSNFLINLGYGDISKVYPRAPRPDFSKFCQVL